MWHTIDSDKEDESEDDAVKSEPAKLKTVAKVTRPQGRYKRREKGKLVNSYSSKDLEGILVSFLSKQFCPVFYPLMIKIHVD